MPDMGRKKVHIFILKKLTDEHRYACVQRNIHDVLMKLLSYIMFWAQQEEIDGSVV